MEMSGERLIAADRATVWAALNDPEVLKAAIPGCQEIDKTSATEFTAKVVQKVGPVKATFTGEVELQDIVEGESYRIVGRGKGGAAGAASGGAHVTLADAEGGTLLSYEAEAKVTGKIAQLGSRLIDGFAKKMADEFFNRFRDAVEGEGGATAAGGAGTAAGAAAAAGAATASAATNDGARDFADEAMETAEEALDTINEGTRRVSEQLGEAIDSAAETIAETADDLREAAEPQVKSWWKKLFG